MGTWKLVDKPPGMIPIANKFVFAKKRDKEGKLLKYKARLVAKGCTQCLGYNYLETHSPVVRMETIRSLLAVAAKHKLYIHQMDIKGAYLNGILKEKVYMKQPEGYNDGSGRVCLLIKTLYGLKQAGCEWNHEFDSKMRKRRYTCLQSDPCMYVWHIGEDFAIIAVWVDDLLIFTTTIDLRDKAKTDIEREWEVTDLGEPQKIIGIEITRTPESITISSSQYIDSILHKEGLSGINAVATPLDLNIQLVHNPEGNDGNCSNSFATLLGELQYIADVTRPDISYVVNRLASYTANPSLQYTTAIKRILRYLAGTRNLSIIYKANTEYPDFIGYTDASYSNADNHKSISGYVFIASGRAITWSLKKQLTKALSSTEAEYIAMSESAREACWLRSLHMELGILETNVLTQIHGDNKGSIMMAKNPVFHKRAKHIAIRWHWVRDLVQDAVIDFESVCDLEQTADILTKALLGFKHKKHIKEMGLVSA